MINTLFSNPILFFIDIIALFTAITIHEFSHAWMTDYLGDPTPRLQGRLKLNPFVHIDLTGLLFMLFFGFGWGKPVVFDPYNLKNPKKDSALISLAGPGSNFILAIILALVLKLLLLANFGLLSAILKVIIINMIGFNIILGVFNLLPIHPLDGFKIVAGILPEDKAEDWLQLQKYGMLFLILLIIPLGKTSMLDSILSPLVSFFIRLLVPTSGTGIV